MKTGIVGRMLLGALLALFFFPVSSLAEESEPERPTASAEVGVFTKYIWRGYELSDDSVVIQPSATVSYKGFSFNVWGNLDTELDDMDPTTEDTAKWNETDLTVSYERSFGPVNLGAGYIYYALDGMDDSQEVFFSVGLDVLLSPTLTVYREIYHLPGWYLSFGISHTVELPKGLTLDLSGSVGAYISDDEDTFVAVDKDFMPTAKKYRAFHNGLVSAALNIPIGQYLTITPMVAYSFPLSDRAHYLLTSASFSGRSDFFYAGATVSISF